jgi:hypothetical protein
MSRMMQLFRLFVLVEKYLRVRACARFRNDKTRHDGRVFVRFARMTTFSHSRFVSVG